MIDCPSIVPAWGRRIHAPWRNHLRKRLRSSSRQLPGATPIRNLGASPFRPSEMNAAQGRYDALVMITGLQRPAASHMENRPSPSIVSLSRARICPRLRYSHAKTQIRIATDNSAPPYKVPNAIQPVLANPAARPDMKSTSRTTERRSDNSRGRMTRCRWCAACDSARRNGPLIGTVRLSAHEGLNSASTPECCWCCQTRRHWTSPRQ